MEDSDFMRAKRKKLVSKELTLFDDLFGAAHGYEVKICQIYRTLMKLGKVIFYLKKIQKYIDLVSSATSLEFCWHHIIIFYQKLPSFVISRNTNIDWVLILSFYLLLAFKCSFNKNGFNFNDGSQICYSRASEAKGIFNKAYDVVSFAYNVPNKKLLCDSNYIVDVVM